MKIGVVAGEASGDILAAGLLEELRRRHPELEAEGIAGARMEAAGCRTLWPLEKLSVMGLSEVLAHLPELLGIRRAVIRHFTQNPPAVFIGVDSPDFNLGLERRLRHRGIRTVQYVSPTVWAWREGRAAKIGQSADLVLCLFPFEPEIYARYGINAVFVGHPLADEIPRDIDPAGARRRLGLDPQGQYLALLPGSRMSEVSRLAQPFLETATWLLAREQTLKFLLPAATARLRIHLQDEIARAGLADHVVLIDGQSREAMAAADVVLLASGTATLEALLLERPMVVSYRVSPLTYWLVRTLRLLKLPYVSMPNILAGSKIVPEYLQAEARADRLGPELLELLRVPAARRTQTAVFGELHEQLRCNANARAADAVLELLAQAE